MVTATVPNPNFVASVPLQYVFIDKDTADPLSFGVVTFYSDPSFTVKKSVFEISNVEDNQVSFVELPNPLILSSIGTFVDPSGNNLVPYYWPWDSIPGPFGINPPGDPQPYFITVYNNNGVFQFSLTYWPPDSLSGGASGNSQTALTQNQITNPQFSQVLFPEVPIGSGTFTYSVSGVGTLSALAPGWFLQTSGTGNVVVSQVSLSSDNITEPPFAIQINPQTGLTVCNLLQRIQENPRLLVFPAVDTNSSFINGGFAASGTGSVPLQMFYQQSNLAASSSVPPAIVLGTMTTAADGSWMYASTSNEVITPYSSDGPNGYVDVWITIPIASTVQISSVQLVQVASTNMNPSFIQQSIPEQTSNLYWFDKPQLFYKPITNYTIGWDFPFNPCQQYGLTGNSVFPTSAAAAYYIDQTIIYQTVVSSISYTVSNSTGLNLSTANATTYALIQYLDTAQAVELLNQRMAVSLKGFVTDNTIANQTLIGSINLYYSTTTNPTVPALPAVFFNNLSGSGAAIAPETLTSGWHIVPLALSPAAFELTTTSQTFNFNGWNATAVSGINSATAFAIVVAFNTQATTTVNTLNFITLCGGDIATRPAPMTIAETRHALEYYFETSYNYTVPPGTSAAVGNLFNPQQLSGISGTVVFYPSAFSINYRTSKRANATPVVYALNTGTINAVTGDINAATGSRSGDIACGTGVSGTQWTSTNGEYGAAFGPAAGNAGQLTTAVTAPVMATIAYHYTANAQLGVVT